MSDRPDFDQMRERILWAAREIEQISREATEPGDYFRRFLSHLVPAAGGRAGAIRVRGADGRVGVLCEQGLSQGEFAGDAAIRTWGDEIAKSTLASGEAGIHRSPSGNGHPAGPVLLTSPLHVGRDCAGVVEIYQRPDYSHEAAVAMLQFLEQMCGHASRFLATHHAGAPEAWRTFRDEFEQTSLRLHRGLETPAVCSIAANDGRTLLGADRVSVAILRRGKARVMAVSGQESVNRKSNLVRAMSKLMSAVSAARDPLFFEGESETLPPSLILPMSEYLKENTTQVVAIVPLLDNPPAAREDDPTRSKPKPPKVIGCLVVDGPGHAGLASRLEDAIRLMADHTAAALANSLTYHRIFLLPVWRFLGRGFDVVRGRTALLVAFILALVIAAGTALVVVPWDYRVTAEGRLMPVVQRQIFAPWDGEVVEIGVRDGQRVHAGDVLLTIRSDDLKTQLLTTRNELNEKRERILTLHAQIDEATKKSDRDEETRLQGELAATQVQVQGLEKQVELWETRQQQLVLKAPMDGVVATFRVEQLLLNRPVRRGEVLVEVMNDKGDWRLEVEIPENRMGHLRAAQESEPARPVEFLLATSPESTYHGTLGTVGTRTSTTEEHGSVVEAYVDLEPEQPPTRAIGAEVRAKVDCGQRSLGYVLFGDFIEYVRKTLWL